MPKFSILLPTLRPQLFASALHSIQVNSAGHDYEVVVVSPFQAQGDRVRWVKETQARGCVAAFAQTAHASVGDILVSMTDDRIALPGWLDLLEAKVREGERRSFPFCLDLCRVNDPFFHTVFGRLYALNPVASRKSVDAVGEFWDPSFTAHWADPDFSLRVWNAGGRVEFSELSCIAGSTLQAAYSESPHKSRGYEQDRRVFMSRWAHLAEDRFSTEDRDMNRYHPLKALKDNTALLPQIRKYGRVGGAFRAAGKQVARLAPGRIMRRVQRAMKTPPDQAAVSAMTAREMYEQELRSL